VCGGALVARDAILCQGLVGARLVWTLDRFSSRCSTSGTPTTTVGRARVCLTFALVLATTAAGDERVFDLTLGAQEVAAVVFAFGIGRG
jgi:hypothetical protein